MSAATTRMYRHYEIDVGDWLRRWPIPIQAETCEITYPRRDRRIGNEFVALSWTRCHLGGWRGWFICPRCGRRVGKLYHAVSLACRGCYRLKYRSQWEDEYGRAVLRIDKMRERLRWPPGFAHGIYGRPKGMHQKTFRRLLAEYVRLESFVVRQYVARTEAAIGRMEAFLYSRG
jgi:hypothetical protein